VAVLRLLRGSRVGLEGSIPRGFTIGIGIVTARGSGLGVVGIRRPRLGGVLVCGGLAIVVVRWVEMLWLFIVSHMFYSYNTTAGFDTRRRPNICNCYTHRCWSKSILNRVTTYSMTRNWARLDS